MGWFQTTIQLRPRARGIHLVTHEIQQAIAGAGRVRVGLVHLFLQHTSAALCLNENADPDVRSDLESFLDRMVPDGASYFEHTLEGADDMPAHAKSVVVGCSLTVPMRDGRLALGTWQGVYLLEFRDSGGARSVVITVHGE